jgi:hypothetical protein
MGDSIQRQVARGRSVTALAVEATLVAALLVAACAPRPDKPALSSTFEGSCSDMCQAFKRLGCVTAEPTPAGVTCVERCETQLRTGVVAPPIACVVKMRDPGELEEICGERCR